MRGFVLNHKQIEWAYAKWCEGYRHIDIALALNVSEKTVRRALKGRVRIRPVLKYEEE